MFYCCPSDVTRGEGGPPRLNFTKVPGETITWKAERVEWCRWLKKGQHHFRTMINKRSSVFGQKIGWQWHHQLSYRVTPTLETPLWCPFLTIRGSIYQRRPTEVGLWLGPRLNWKKYWDISPNRFLIFRWKSTKFGPFRPQSPLINFVHQQQW